MSIGTFVLVSPLGFLIHGTSGNIPANATVQAYLAENMNFRWQEPKSAQISTAIQATPDNS